MDRTIADLEPDDTPSEGRGASTSRPIDRRRAPAGEWRWALLEADVSPTEQHVALVLAVYMDADGAGARPSVRTLADRSGRKRETVMAALTRLVELGWLNRSPGAGRRATSYAATIPDAASGPRRGTATDGGAAAVVVPLEELVVPLEGRSGPPRGATPPTTSNNHHPTPPGPTYRQPPIMVAVEEEGRAADRTKPADDVVAQAVDLLARQELDEQRPGTVHTPEGWLHKKRRKLAEERRAELLAAAHRHRPATGAELLAALELEERHRARLSSAAALGRNRAAIPDVTLDDVVEEARSHYPGDPDTAAAVVEAYRAAHAELIGATG